MDNVRLNHFILWCKNWYQSYDNNEDIFDSALKSLKLDGYEFATKKDVIPIILNFLDELQDKIPSIKNKNYLRLFSWHNEIQRLMNVYGFDYQHSLLFTIKNFFCFGISRKDLLLIPPIYSRKLFKLGFVAPKHFGNSYKLANYKVKKFFKEDK